MSSVPAPLVLDMTLHDFYTSEGDGEDITLAYTCPTAEVQLTTGLPLSRKFIYQSPLYPIRDVDTLNRVFLHLVPQALGFMAGKMPLVMFDSDPDAEESSLVLNSESRRPYQTDVHRVLDRLVPHQRPELTFVQKPSDIKLEQDGRIGILIPMDCLLPLPHLVDPEAHYEALSKRGLALSGLPTPDTVVEDTDLDPAEVYDKDFVDFEVLRLISRVHAHQLPFVIKMPQSLGGQGTFIVRTPRDRMYAIRIIEPETKRMLRQLNPQNSHMSPCCLILQSIVPGEAVALSFFVTKSGGAVFNACCSQLYQSDGSWAGGFCDYREQDVLQKQYEDTASKIGAYVHKFGYWGPMGADIMTDASDRQVVIDMNIRVTGTHPLGALRSHFRKRGLNVAALFFSLMLKLTMDDFEKQFEEVLHFGSMVVNAWVHMRGGKTSIAILILAAEDEQKLCSFAERLDLFKL